MHRPDTRWRASEYSIGKGGINILHSKGNCSLAESSSLQTIKMMKSIVSEIFNQDMKKNFYMPFYFSLFNDLLFLGCCCPVHVRRRSWRGWSICWCWLSLWSLWIWTCPWLCPPWILWILACHKKYKSLNFSLAICPWLCICMRSNQKKFQDF